MSFDQEPEAQPTKEEWEAFTNRRFSRLLNQEVASDSEEWRHECECVAILNMPSRDRRNEHLRLMEKIRGVDAVNKIRRDGMTLWQMQQQEKQNGKI